MTRAVGWIVRVRQSALATVAGLSAVVGGTKLPRIGMICLPKMCSENGFFLG